MFGIEAHGGSFGGGGSSDKLKQAPKIYNKGFAGAGALSINMKHNDGTKIAVSNSSGRVSIFDKKDVALQIDSRAILSFLPSLTSPQLSSVKVQGDRVYIPYNINSSNGQYAVYDLAGTLIRSTANLGACDLHFTNDPNYLLMVQTYSDSFVYIRLYDKDLNQIWQSSINYAQNYGQLFTRVDVANNKICFLNVRYYEYNLTTGAQLKATTGNYPNSYRYRLSDTEMITAGGAGTNQVLKVNYVTDTIVSTYNRPSGTVDGMIAVDDTHFWFAGFNPNMVFGIAKSNWIATPEYAAGIAQGNVATLPQTHLKNALGTVLGNSSQLMITESVEYYS